MLSSLPLFSMGRTSQATIKRICVRLFPVYSRIGDYACGPLRKQVMLNPFHYQPGGPAASPAQPTGTSISPGLYNGHPEI